MILDGGQDWQLLFNLAVVQDKLGNLEAAVGAYRRAAELNPELPDAHLRNALAKLAIQKAAHEGAEGKGKAEE